MIKVGVDFHTDDRENFRSPLLLRPLIVMVSMPQRFCGLLTGARIYLYAWYTFSVFHTYFCVVGTFILLKKLHKQQQY